MAAIIGQRVNNVVRQGTRWWAEGGLIHWEVVNPTIKLLDERKNRGTQTVRDTLERMKSLSEMLGNGRNQPGYTEYSDEILEQRQYLDDMLELCRLAKSQGMPDSAKHQEQMRRDGRSRVVTGGGRRAF
jgi:hypothetical protein